MLQLKRSIIIIFSIYLPFSFPAYAVTNQFLEVISSTVMKQETIFEVEKTIYENIQKKKVAESDYKPIVEGEFTGSLLIYDNFRKKRGLVDDNKHDFNLTSILKIYDFGRKELIYESKDKSTEIAKFNMLKVKNSEAERLFRIYSDYASSKRKMELLKKYELFLNSQGEKIRDKFKLGGGTILEMNQFEQLVNGFVLQKQSVARDLRDAKSEYNLYFAVAFNGLIFPNEQEISAKAYNLAGDPFNSEKYNIEESLLDLEIQKSRLEQSVTSSEAYPDITLGLKLTKFDVFKVTQDFELRATLTSRVNLFDGFKRHHTVRSQSERIGSLAAKLRNAKLIKDQRLSEFKIRYFALDEEASVEVEKIKKTHADWDIAKEMSAVTTLDLGTEIRYASSILSSELRLLDIEAEQGFLVIQSLGTQGSLPEYFNFTDVLTESF